MKPNKQGTDSQPGSAGNRLIKQNGFSLLEMLVALAISSTLLLGAARMLPRLQLSNLQILLRFQLQEELQLIVATLQKAIIRAGYCHGVCTGNGLITTSGGRCLLVRWDENSNGKWEGVNSAESDFYGFRFRQGDLEMQRGVASCEGSGWERLNDPATLTLADFRITRNGKQLKLKIDAYARAFPQQRITLERWVTARNL